MFKHISYQNAVMLYWDLPEEFQKGEKFLVYCDNEKLGDTENCHFKAENLFDDKGYQFIVKYEKSDGDVSEIGNENVFTEKIRKRIDITAAPYFAKGDGKTINTKAIQKAIDDCKAGECVYIPSGDFMSGSVRLHSDMELYIEKGGILHGTSNYADYEPKIKSRFEGIEMMTYAGLVNIGELDREKGYNCKNVRICGEGKIYGGGVELANSVIDRELVLMKDYMDSLGEKLNECETSKTIPGRLRPRLINMSCAENVVISGIGIENGASWNVHMIYSDNIVTCGCTFRSEKVWNGDGWDPDSSTNCTLFASEFFTGDDAVAIKSGKNPEGNIINKPAEHIRVFDCVSRFGHGITIGSEMSGGINDVKIWNCDMRNSTFGVEIKGTKKRGGYVRNVNVRFTDVCRILMHSVPYNDDGEPGPDMPYFENCCFSDMVVSARFKKKDGTDEYCNPITLVGFDKSGHFIKNIKFKNIVIDNGTESKTQHIVLQRCEGITLENVYCR